MRNAIQSFESRKHGEARKVLRKGISQQPSDKKQMLTVADDLCWLKTTQQREVRD